MSSRRFPFGELLGAVASAGAHVGLIALAIAAQASSADPRSFAAPHERVEWVDAARWTARSAAATPPAVSTSRPRVVRRSRGALPPLRFLPPELERLAAVPSIPAATPELDLSAVASDVADALGGDGAVGSFVQAASAGAYRKASITTLYTQETVDRIAAPMPRNPKPRYPPALVMSRLEGTFVVRFVIDTAGRVEPASLQFPDSVHEYFVEAVRYALLRSRYYPAEAGGRSVRQLVEQRFAFVIEMPR